MGRRSVAMASALVLVFLAAGALTAEGRSHASFSATSYYTEEKPLVTAADAKTEDKAFVTPADAQEKTDTTVHDPLNRYPDGYTNQAHHYNPVTEKYDDEEKMSNPQKNVLTSTEKPTTTEPMGTIPNRYEAGYTFGQGTHTASYAQTNDPLTFDPEKGRYPMGYYPQSTYNPQKTTTTGGVSLAAQNSYQQTTQTTSGDLMHRYEKGYFPASSYTQNGYAQQQQKPVTSYSSYTGNFNTMPYPVSGVPFVASGAGCRTAYWAANPAMWPSFLSVKSTLGDAFGSQATAAFGQTTVLQALMKYGTDPFSQLAKSGSTALLNSYTRGAYPVSHMKVIEQFNAALVSKEAATAQALAFETDNVESISAGSACT